MRRVGGGGDYLREAIISNISVSGGLFKEIQFLFCLQEDGPITEELLGGGGLWMEVYSTVHANLSLTLYFSYKLQVEKFIVH